MVANRRRGEEAIPANYKSLLTMDQIDGLRKLESFGWSLLYVRRPKFEPVQVVLIHSDGKSHAVLGVSGELEEEATVKVRGDGEDITTQAPRASESLAMVDHEPLPTASPATPQYSGQKEPPPSTPSGIKPPPKYLV